MSESGWWGFVVSRSSGWRGTGTPAMYRARYVRAALGLVGSCRIFPAKSSELDSTLTPSSLNLDPSTDANGNQSWRFKPARPSWHQQWPWGGF
jgi:hypothetical protein